MGIQAAIKRELLAVVQCEITACACTGRIPIVLISSSRCVERRIAPLKLAIKTNSAVFSDFETMARLKRNLLLITNTDLGIRS